MLEAFCVVSGVVFAQMYMSVKTHQNTCKFCILLYVTYTPIHKRGRRKKSHFPSLNKISSYNSHYEFMVSI